jgi:hypothetical protein
MTIMEETESERVCHASATIAMEPDTIPAQYFRANSTRLTIIETQPALTIILVFFGLISFARFYSSN